MNETFALLDPANAQEFLQSFPAPIRRKGTNLLRKGYVRDITADQPGSLYSVAVTDPFQPDVCQVELEYDADLDGWSGLCSCAEELDCPHVYAAMSALLAENSTATVRNLSAGVVRGVAGVAKGPNKPPAPGTDLARMLADALGRALKPEEAKFVRKIQGAYARCRSTRQITYWDFEEMGLRLGGYGWEGLQIWPAFPENEHQFWLYVAYAAQQRKAPIPAFMEPVTNFALVEDRLAQWRREREIERWTKALGNLHLTTGTQPAQGQALTELRVMIEDTEALLQWQRPGRADFETIKSQQLSRLANQTHGETLSLSTESELLWRLVESRYYYGAPAHFRYQDAEAGRILGRLLRAKLLESRIVNFIGDPLLRPAEPLRWQLTPAENEHDDYRLQLVQADGSKLARICCVLPGTPNLYLTPKAVFQGPPPHDGMLNPLTETRIPAPAIERTGGVALLQSLGLEMPPRVRERVHTLPFQVVIACQLQPIYHGSKTEECSIRVLAEAPDGHQQAWIGNGWSGQQPGRSVKATKGVPDITLYDWAALQQVPALLEPLELKPSTFGGTMVLRVTKKFPEIFATWLKTVPAHITVQLAGDLASFASADVAGRVTLEVSEAAIDWFDLRVVLNVTDTTLTPDETKLLLNAKGGYVRLEGKGWRRLQYDLSDDENERLAKLGLNARELTSEPQRLHALQLADDAANKFLPEEQVAQIQRRVGEIKARVAPELPGTVTAQLRPYQLEGFHFLAYLSTNRFGGILADDMGLGKTVQALAWMTWLREQQTVPANGDAAPKPAPGLVVCPKSVMDNWRAEAERFTPGLRVKVWPASEVAELKDRVTEADLHVLNYNQLRLLGESLAPVRWGPVILDEGQYIKNPNSQTAQIARALKTEHRLVLSGTPIENRLLDLWSLMAFAMPGVLGSRAQFARLYDAKGDPFARRRLSARVRPFLLRRTKAQVAKDLPDRIEEDLFCEIEGEQKTLYRAELKRAQQLLLRVKTQKELASQHFNFLTSLLRLRQICCHPRLVNDQTQASGAKMEALLEQLEPIMEEGNKVLVFSQFVTLLDLLKPALEARDWPVFYLAGHTENRGELVQQFQTAPGAGIFLISLKAGGFGLNLTAASYVVLFDPWWNPAVENQAIDRTHRIGQVNKVIAYRLLIKDSIEEKIRALQKQKNALAQDVLGEEKFSQSLTLEDLHFLLAD